MSNRNLWKAWAACTVIWVFIALMNAVAGNTLLVVVDVVVAIFQAVAAYATYQQYNTGD